MTPDEIEDIAFQNRGMPEGLNAAEQMLFQSFRKLYAYAKLVGMAPEEGKAEKAELLKAFRKANGEIKYAHHRLNFWIEIEAAGTKFAKEQTIENAIAFQKAVYGVGLKEVQK